MLYLLVLSLKPAAGSRVGCTVSLFLDNPADPDQTILTCIFLQDLAQLLACQHRLQQLTLQEMHELEELDTLDPASLWDVLAAALPVLTASLQVCTVVGTPDFSVTYCSRFGWPLSFPWLLVLFCTLDLLLSNARCGLSSINTCITPQLPRLPTACQRQLLRCTSLS